MAKLDDLIQQKQQRDEDWKAKKTAEREELRQLSDDAVMRVTSEPNAYLRYLDTQAINPQYSAANVMLAMAQNPDITYINSLENWGRLGRSVNREETGLKIRVSDPYVKDGRQYHGYTVLFPEGRVMLPAYILASFGHPKGAVSVFFGYPAILFSGCPAFLRFIQQAAHGFGFHIFRVLRRSQKRQALHV